MNLKDYLAQENPIRHPQVILDESEITRSRTIKFAGELFTYIFINVDYHNSNLVNGIEYIVLGSNGNLWTTDDDGNPKSRSVFKLK
jgi:hypothetical protein